MSVATAEIVDHGLQPVAKAAQVETSVNYHARSILDAFASVKDNSQTRLIVQLALSGMSCHEYDLIEKSAAKMADKMDELAGFITSKERRYGPKRNSLNTQASERRQVFGAVKHGGIGILVSIPESGLVNFDTLPAWQQARATARDYLKGKSIDWQGQASDDKRRAREQKADSRAWEQARNMAEQQNPQQPGETYAMWQTRILEAAQDIRAEIDDSLRTKELEKEAKGLYLEYGNMGAVELAEMLLSMAKQQATEATF